MMELEKELEAVFELYDDREYQKAYDGLVKWLSGKKAAGETNFELDEAWLEPICELCFRVNDYEAIVALCNAALAALSQPDELGLFDVYITNNIKFKAFRAEAKVLMALAQSREVREAPPIQSDDTKLDALAATARPARAVALNTPPKTETKEIKNVYSGAR